MQGDGDATLIYREKACSARPIYSPEMHVCLPFLQAALRKPSYRLLEQCCQLLDSTKYDLCHHTDHSKPTYRPTLYLTL